MSKIEEEPTFEQSIRNLESIVSKLERGDGDLSAALAGYETGVRLLARCHAMLDAAEKSVSLLSGVDPDGEPLLSPFDPAPKPEQGK